MSYQLDTPYTNQVIFLNSQNSIYKNIDGEGFYYFTLQTPVQVPTNCQMLMSITDAQLPNISPNVNSTNNKISFHIPTFSRFFTIQVQDGDGTDALYSVYEFLNIVNEKILPETLDDFVLYGQYNNTQAKVKWFCDYPFEIINTTSYPTTCIDLLGFKKDTNNEAVQNGDVLLSSTINPSFHIKMPSCVNFSGSRFIFLKFKNISVMNLNSRGLTDNAMVRIDNNAQLGHMIFYKPVEIQRFIVGKQIITNISFTLTDVNGNELNLFSNDAQITIKIEYVYKPEMRSVEEGTINYELRKLGNLPKDKASFEDIYNPVTNTFQRD